MFFDVHVLLFWVFSLILGLMSFLGLFLGFKKNIEEQVLIFLQNNNNNNNNNESKNDNKKKLDLKFVYNLV